MFGLQFPEYDTSEAPFTMVQHHGRAEYRRWLHQEAMRMDYMNQHAYGYHRAQQVGWYPQQQQQQPNRSDTTNYLIDTYTPSLAPQQPQAMSSAGRPSLLLTPTHNVWARPTLRTTGNYPPNNNDHTRTAAAPLMTHGPPITTVTNRTWIPETGTVLNNMGGTGH